MQEYTTESERLLKEFEAASEAEREILAGVQECSKNQELIATKNTAIQRKKEELKKRFMEIGALPADAFDKYQNLSHKQLEKKLLQCNQELKKYENVNKKALDQFVSFSEQKEKLVKRKDELDLAKNVRYFFFNYATFSTFSRSSNS
jgi:structural maintenance of chromosome 3 (chondroitin sulfate proteoglycan 6)